MFRPCGFPPLRRLPPHRRFGCIATRTGQGSPRLAAARPPFQQAGPKPVRRFPATRAPLEEPSSSAAVPHRCGRFLLAVIPRDPACPPLLRGGAADTRDETTPRSTFHCKQCSVSLSDGGEPGSSARPSEERRSTVLCAWCSVPEGSSQPRKIGKRTSQLVAHPPRRSAWMLHAHDRSAEAKCRGVDPLQGLVPLMTLNQPLLVAKLQGCFSSFHGLLFLPATASVPALVHRRYGSPAWVWAWVAK